MNMMNYETYLSLKRYGGIYPLHFALINVAKGFMELLCTDLYDNHSSLVLVELFFNGSNDGSSVF